MGIQDAAPDLSSASMYGVVNAGVTIETFMAVTFPTPVLKDDGLRR